MSDLGKYIRERKKKDIEFAKGFEEGYEEFKIGVMLRQARETAGLHRKNWHADLKRRKLQSQGLKIMQKISSYQP